MRINKSNSIDDSDNDMSLVWRQAIIDFDTNASLLYTGLL